MKKHIPLIAVSLLLSLFIYLFYRTDKTVVNQGAILLLGDAVYTRLKSGVNMSLPLPEFFIYSLPEGLWVFSISLTSSVFYVMIRGRRWHLIYMPFLLAFVMEVWQLFQITKGRFDVLDLLCVAISWALAFIMTRKDQVKEPLFASFDASHLCCVGSYLIVYLAHVI